MEIQLTYRFSHLDKEKQIGILSLNDENYATYMKWVWFHLGRMIGDLNYHIYPYSLIPFGGGKIVYTYKFCNDARRQAEMLATKICKVLEPASSNSN